MQRRGEPGADGTLDGVVDIVNVNRKVLKAEIAGTDRRTLIAVRSFCPPTNSNLGYYPKGRCEARSRIHPVSMTTPRFCMHEFAQWSCEESRRNSVPFHERRLNFEGMEAG
jgi:hypothetical protein